jgi:hypothetical protein
VKVRIAAPAKEQAQLIDRWWRTHRPAAPDLFARELAAARRLLESTPDIGSPYLERQGVVVRRVTLRKTRHHVYYEIDRREEIVMILAVGVYRDARHPSYEQWREPNRPQGPDLRTASPSVAGAPPPMRLPIGVSLVCVAGRPGE